MALIRQLVCVVGLAASAAAAHSAPPNATPPNIVLITLDTTRADRMGFLGSPRGLTPNLDALARQSVVFARAYAQVPLTTSSHATILTGTYPQFHQVNNFGVRLATDLPYAPDILRAHGYHTAAFVGSIILDPSGKFAPGFDRGFDTYDADFYQGPPGADRYHTTERRGGVVVAHALAWLNRRPRGPFFIWVHLYDPHDPYDPPEPYKSRYKSAPYDGEIAYADSAVGKLLGQLRRRGLYENSVIAVMADHGESLGAHGEDFHGYFLYDETIHVPLVFKMPAEHFGGKQIESRAGLVDVLPTILQAVGIAVPQEMQGESLLEMMKPGSTEKDGGGPAPETSPDRPAYAETDYPYSAFRWSPLRSLRTGKYLFIEAPRRELYDEGADAKAEHNLAPASKAVSDTLESRLGAFRQKTSSSREAPKVDLDPGQQEKLAALGYISAGSSEAAGREPKDAGADPKDKIQVGNMIHRANSLIDDGRFNEAVPLLQQLIAEEPESTLLYLKLGESWTRLKDFSKATQVLRKAVELSPGVDPHFRLGLALMGAGDFAAAASEFEAVAALVPKWDQAHLMLAAAYLKTDRAREAVTECEKVLEVDPDHYGALLLEGRVLVLSKQAEAALPRLQKAAALEPKAPQPHTFLADAYVEMGRKTDAARERAAAKRLGASDKEAARSQE